jgi:MoaD family protein
MQVSIRFFTSLREMVGKKEQILQIPKDALTIQEALQTLTVQYGKSFSDYLFDQKTGHVKGFLQLLINGKSVPNNDSKTKLHDGDILAILPPVGGG